MSARSQRRVSRVLSPTQITPWDRSKLIGVLAAAFTAGLLLVLGLGLAVYYTLQPGPSTALAHRASGDGESSGPSSAPSAAVPGSRQYRQDILAARAMPTVGFDAAQPGTVSTRSPGVLVVPVATRTGPDGVPSGYPHTPEGALAQLAAIDKTAMQSASLAGVRAVIADWVAAGGPSPATWSGVKAMADFLNAAGLSGGGSVQLALVVTPLMGLIKATVGADFVIPCVDFEFDATLQSTARVADADCQRMVWQGDRWVIGAGREPADPPSVWADTDTAIAVGYQDLRNG